jgi:gliding motility-associated-like protein
MLRIIDTKNCQRDTMVTIGEPEKLHLDLDPRYTVYPFCPDWENGAIAIRVTGGTPNYQYRWTGYASETDSILNNVKEDFYNVRVIDAHECVADSVFRLVALNNNCLQIPTAFTPNYDNANDTWDISYINENGGESSFHEVYPNGVIQIYDRLGNLVYRCTGGCNESWNGEDLKGRRIPADSYYYIIELNNGEDQPPLKGIVTIIR